MNDCILFYGPYSNLLRCPICKQDRYALRFEKNMDILQGSRSHHPGSSVGNDFHNVNAKSKSDPKARVSRRIYRYLPLHDRLRALFKQTAWATIFHQSYDYRIRKKREQSAAASHHHMRMKMNDSWDGDLWNNILEDEPEYDSPHHLFLALCTDGVLMNRFGPQKHLWPILLSCLNFPHWLRCQSQLLWFTGLIPGPSVKNISVYFGMT